MSDKDAQVEEWRQWGVARAAENWARCVNCLAVPPLDGKYYCADCILKPCVVWRIQTWNGFWGSPNPLPWKMLRVPYDKDGAWEEWMEPEYWQPLTGWERLRSKLKMVVWWWCPYMSTVRQPPSRWQAWWNKQKMALGRLKWQLTKQPGWDDERPD